MKFDIYATYSIGVHVGTFEGKTLKQAIRKAEEAGIESIGLCWQCCSAVGDSTLEPGEIYGEPTPGSDE